MFVAAVPLNNFRKRKVSATKCKLGAVELESLVEMQTVVWLRHSWWSPCREVQKRSSAPVSVEDALIRGGHLGALVET